MTATPAAPSAKAGDVLPLYRIVTLIVAWWTFKR